MRESLDGWVDRLRVHGQDLSADTVRHAFDALEQRLQQTSPPSDVDSPYRIVALLLRLARVPSSHLSSDAPRLTPLRDLALRRSKEEEESKVPPHADDDGSEENDDDGWAAEYNRSTSDSEEDEQRDTPSSPPQSTERPSRGERPTDAERWTRLHQRDEGSTPLSSDSSFLHALDVVWHEVGLTGAEVAPVPQVEDDWVEPSKTTGPLLHPTPSLQWQLQAEVERLGLTASVRVVRSAFVVAHLLLLCQHLPSQCTTILNG